MIRRFTVLILALSLATPVLARETACPVLDDSLPCSACTASAVIMGCCCTATQDGASSPAGTPETQSPQRILLDIPVSGPAGLPVPASEPMAASRAEAPDGWKPPLFLLTGSLLI